MRKEDAIWIYGKHSVRAAVLSKKRKVLRIILSPQNKDFFAGIEVPVKVEIVDKNSFACLFKKDAGHQGCAALVQKLDGVDISDLEDDGRPIVFLDQVTDPQNIGSILRASAVFGAKAVVLPETNAPEINSAILKAASGAGEIVPIVRVKNLVQSMKNLKKKGYWCLGLDERGDKEIHEIKLNGKFIFVIGSEGRGMRRLTREHCEFLVKIPSSGSFTTLNAAQAATVSLYEILKQNRSRE